MTKRTRAKTASQTELENISEEKEAKAGSKTELKAPVPRRPIWSGSLAIGLINVPVKLYPMIYDKGIKFHFLHKPDGQPLKYERVCTKDGKLVPWKDIEKGYEIAKGEYVVFDKKEFDAIKPESDKRIRINKFVDYFSIDPIYFYSSFILTPDEDKDAYALLFTALERKGKACAGRITLRTKEYPAIVHAYNGALVLTTLRYSYDVADPRSLEEVKKLGVPSKAEVELAIRIINELSGEFDITEYRDAYNEKVEELIQKKAKGEKIVVEKPPEKEEARELMVALRETLKQLENK